MGPERVRVLVYEQELGLDLEQVQDLVRKPEPGLDTELPTQAYKRGLGLESPAFETKVQPLKFDGMLTEQWSPRGIAPEPIDFAVLVGARRNTVYLLPNCYN